MKILSIDTSSNICGVAILEDNKLIKELSLDNELTHSESLMPTINQILIETEIRIEQIGLLVCDKGPGSFTGIRIGTSTVLAFSDSLGIFSCGINSLQALAYNVENDGIICSLIDAKNSNCYCGVYKLSNGTYTLLEPLAADHIDIILDNLKKYTSPIVFVGSGATENEEIIKDRFLDCIISKNNNLSAYKLGLAGLQAYTSGKVEDVMPLYLRKSQAERALEEKSKNN